jgi:hypothetical protein
MFDYLLQMGAMQPEQQDMKRKQEIVNMLRQNAMQAPQGQMIGKHYVAPNLMQYAAQMGTAAMAGADQNALNTQFQGMNDRQRQMLEELRRRRMAGAGATPGYSGPIVYGTSEGE